MSSILLKSSHCFKKYLIQDAFCRRFNKSSNLSISSPRRYLKIFSKGFGFTLIAISLSGGIYYSLSDAITKRQIKVTVEGIGRFIR